jgi:hypothetical protein
LKNKNDVSRLSEKQRKLHYLGELMMEAQEKEQALEALGKRSDFENNLVIKAYEDEAFRQQLLADPKSVYEQELGMELPDSVNLQVVEEQPNTIYMVLPRKTEAPMVEGELSDEALEAVAGGGWGVVASRSGWVVVWSD